VSWTVIESEFASARAFPVNRQRPRRREASPPGGVFIFGATVTGTTPDGVQLSNGEVIEADLVLSALASNRGRSPSVACRRGPDRRRCLRPHRGIRRVLRRRRRLQWSRCHGRAIRVETWANAQNQATSVAPT
jgi:p-cumate 2,3-dioxygenase ferredoxin reductase subunit